MNDMYCNDYFNPAFSYEPYPICNSQNVIDDYRNSSSSSSDYMSSSSDRVDSFFSPSEGFAKGNMQANIYKPYKLVNPTLPPVYNEKQRMLLEVQKYGFAMWDLNLYLNTHPTDRNVMMLFDKYRGAHKKAMDDYQRKYGALSFEDSDISSGYWAWNKSPWPWEGE